MRLSGLVFAVMLMLLSFTFGCATATVTKTVSSVEASPVPGNNYEVINSERIPSDGIKITKVQVKGTSTILYIATTESYVNGSTIKSISIAAR